MRSSKLGVEDRSQGKDGNVPKLRTSNSKLLTRFSEGGFTLIELLIVLVILSLLAALVGPALVERLKPAKRTVAQSQIEEFMAALDNFYVDSGRYPTNEEGLQALREKPPAAKSWKGPYLKKDVPDDPWGYPYVYRSPGRNGGYEIVSYGADGKEGGEGENADVTSWEANKK
ncbi:MAG TPA: type II secretion system major pseudopilin GspG [bacterium]|nr:type II secretion system major pseudopilin GspG [bacterium]